MQKTFILVANDKSPSDALQALAKALADMGHTIVQYLGGGKLEADEAEIRNAIVSAGREGTVVLIGMSSTQELSRLEIVAAETAMKEEICFGFFSDTFYAYRREWFAPFRNRAEILFISSVAERESAGDFFPIARVAPTGNPSWEDSTDAESRTQEEILEILGADADTSIVLVPFSKTSVTNVDLMARVVTMLFGKLKTFVVFALHPGEIKPDPAALSRYEEFLTSKRADAEWGDIEDGLSRTLFLPDTLSSADVVKVARIVVSSSSPTTDLLAAFHRVPVLNYIGHQKTLERLEKEFGSDTPPLCAIEAAALCRSGLHLSEAMLLAWDRPAYFTEKQAKAFPVRPRLGSAVGRMIRALEV